MRDVPPLIVDHGASSTSICSPRARCAALRSRTRWLSAASVAMDWKERQPALREIITADLLTLTQLQVAVEHASGDEPVLIMGETGPGKGALARAIHALSGRKRFEAIARAVLPALQKAMSQQPTAQVNGGSALKLQPQIGDAARYAKAPGSDWKSELNRPLIAAVPSRG